MTEINSLDLGVNINGKKISMLLYADDNVCLGNTARELQTMLDKLHQWCDRWALKVNTLKTKVMQFIPRGKSKTKCVFKYGTNTIDIVDN